MEGTSDNYGNYNACPRCPELAGWVKDHGIEAFFDAVRNPSAGIAHGYEWTQVTLKDGGQIDGIARSSGDPMMIDSMGGVSQFIPATASSPPATARKVAHAILRPARLYLPCRISLISPRI